MKTLNLLFLIAIALFCSTGAFADGAVVKARIRDINGKPVAGVKVFLYESTNVRKPADFISTPSDEKGQTVINVPIAKYWAVARLKMGALYGPLMPGDKHSGEPVEIDCSDVASSETEFVVADILEVGQKKRTSNLDTVRVRGRVLDKDGNPLANAYVFANRTKEIEYVPEFISASTGMEGFFTLYLPSGGKFFIGAARQFPPPTIPARLKELVPEPGKFDIATDVALIVN